MVNPQSPLTALKGSGMQGALWVADAPCSTIESIQDSTMGPIDCILATTSLRFSGLGSFEEFHFFFSNEHTKK